MKIFKRTIGLLIIVYMTLFMGCGIFKQDIFTGTVTVNKTYNYEVNLGEKTKINMKIFPQSEISDKDSDFVVGCNLTNININNFNYSFNNENSVNVDPINNTYNFTINKKYFNASELKIEVIGTPKEEGKISTTLYLDNVQYSFIDIIVSNKTIYQTYEPFKYELNDYEDVKNKAYDKLDELQDAFDNNESMDTKLIIENEFLNLYEILDDENTKAMMLYNDDLTNLSYKEKYETLDKLVNDLNTKYCKFFVENPDELDEVTELLNDNTKIELEYDMISDYESDMKVKTLYEQVVENNKRIAEIKGYDNYMDYAYKDLYSRDYTSDDAKKIYLYIQEFITPLFKTTSEEIGKKIDELNEEEYDLLIDILEGNYKYLETDYIKGYTNTYPNEYKDAMQSMFKSGNVLFSNNIESKDVAYTTKLNSLDEPLAYFGKINQNLFTITHEMGHYLNEYLNDDELAYEMYETHSQGNELMLLAYLKNVVSKKVYECLELYQMYNYLSTILHSIAIDEFEQYIYSNNVTTDEYDTKFSEICDKYGIDTYIYWRYVVVTNCAYYISYAVSLIPVLDLYMIARSDYNKAQQMYLYMINGEEINYFERLSKAGLMNHFEKDDYKRFTNLLSD